jgi:hypothetical protein
VKPLKIAIGVGTLTALVAAILIFSKVTKHEQISCPAPTERNRLVLLDASSSGRTDDIQQDRLQLVRHQLAEAGVCGGPIAVQAWTTAGTTVTLWSAADELHISGGTEKARANRIGPAVDAAMDQTIVPRYQQALATLPGEQSDFLYWPVLAGDAIKQMNADGKHLPTDVYVASDGVQSDPQIDLNRQLSVDDANQLAQTAPVRADLTDVNVYLVGVGQVAGPPPPAGGTWADAVRAFAETTCKATKANCTALNSSINQPTA